MGTLLLFYFILIVPTQMVVASILVILVCLRMTQSNIIALQTGWLVNGNASLQASDTYSMNTTTVVRVLSVRVCMS